MKTLQEICIPYLSEYQLFINFGHTDLYQDFKQILIKFECGNIVAKILTKEQNLIQDPYIGYTTGILSVLQDKYFIQYNIIDNEYHKQMPNIILYPRKDIILYYLLQEERYLTYIDIYHMVKKDTPGLNFIHVITTSRAIEYYRTGIGHLIAQYGY